MGDETGDVFELSTSEDLSEIRSRVAAAASERDFTALRRTKVLTVASELSRNILDHAGRGTVAIRPVSDGARSGLRLVFEDEGPGIDDVERALEDGVKREGSRGLGKGLTGSRRIADEFSIESTVGRGTRVEVVLWSE